MKRYALVGAAVLAAILALGVYVTLSTAASGAESQPAAALCNAPAAVGAAEQSQTTPLEAIQVQGESTANHPYVGMWVTADGRIRHELLPNGRYDEARGTRESAYRGRYEISGNRIEYWDDTGFTADGVFVGPDVLHHAGMILHRRK